MIEFVGPDTSSSKSACGKKILLQVIRMDDASWNKQALLNGSTFLGSHDLHYKIGCRGAALLLFAFHRFDM